MTVKRWFNQVPAPLCVLLWDPGPYGLHGIETSNPLFFFFSLSFHDSLLNYFFETKIKKRRAEDLV